MDTTTAAGTYSREAFDHFSERARRNPDPNQRYLRRFEMAAMAHLLEAAHAEALREDAAPSFFAQEEDYCPECESYGICTCAYSDPMPTHVAHPMHPTCPVWCPASPFNHISTPAVSLVKAYVPAEAPIVGRCDRPRRPTTPSPWNTVPHHVRRLYRNNLASLTWVIRYSR